VRPGDVELVQVVVTMIVVPAAVAVIVRRDERRLSPARLARAWPPSTRDTVVFATWQLGVLFGCPAVFVWFVRTRRSLGGVLLGLGWAALVFLVANAAWLLPEAAIDWLGL
jgi:hypothetical protein